MDLDRLIHDTKHFAELEDSDVEAFLHERKFKSEHLSIEFKARFPRKKNGKYEIKEICRYIVGLSNEEGGLVVFGVSDNIKDPSVVFPDYVTGLKEHPTLEDLSQWVRERIHPLISSPAIRFFEVENRKIAILKIPPGVNKPYCYHDIASRSVVYFKKTSGGIAELTPDEIREFHRTQLIDQSRRILQSVEFQGKPAPLVQAPLPSKLSKHATRIIAKLENPSDFGLVRICCQPRVTVEIPCAELRNFLTEHRFHFSEALRYYPEIDTFQDGISAGYFPRAVRRDVKSTMRISLYVDGFVFFDALADTRLEGKRVLHSGWLCYELQRQLQLSKELLKGQDLAQISVTLALEHIEGFELSIPRESWAEYSSYTGAHQPITRIVDLKDVYDYDDNENRNIVMPVVRDIMDEVGRIFGLSQAPANIWDSRGYLNYVRGLESQR